MKAENSVLVVEDEMNQANNLCAFLTDAGYDVVGVAPTAEDALAICHRRTPKLALIDFNLGSPIDGLTLARHLNDHYETEVIIVTGSAGAVVAVGECFANRLVVKPYQTEDLLPLLEKYVRPSELT